MQKTRELRNLSEEMSSLSVLQIYGGQGAGKTTCLNAFQRLTAGKLKTALVKWKITFISCQSVIEDSFRCLMKSLGSRISPSEKLRIDEEENLPLAVVRFLMRKRIASLFLCDMVEPSNKQANCDVEVMRSLVAEVQGSVQVVVATPSRNFLFSVAAKSERPSLAQHELRMFTEAEAVEFLMASLGSRSSESVTKNRCVGGKPLPTEDGAGELAAYFACNPLCLKVARFFCEAYNVGYRDYVALFKHHATRERVVHLGARLLARAMTSSRNSYFALNRVSENEKYDTHRVSQFEAILLALSLLCNENVPLLLIGRLFYNISNADYSHEEVLLFCLELVEWMDYYGLVSACHPGYPGGYVSLVKHKLDAGRSPQKSDRFLNVLLATLVGLISKDNRQRPDDAMLLQLRPHIKELTRNVQEFFSRTKSEAPDPQIMQLCKLHELYGQSLIQGRVGDKWEEALKSLEEAALCIWSVVCALNESNWLAACFCFGENVNSKAILYYSTKHPSEAAIYIAKKCVNAGRKAGFVEQYVLSALVLNEANIKDFVQHLSRNRNNRDVKEPESMVSKRPEDQLASIIEAVESKQPIDSVMLDVLRKNELFLSQKDIQSVFFSERLASIFHSYGRQVLYLQTEMNRPQRVKCEYYAELAHHICAATRKATGVGLLYEYIAIANSRVPRMLQNVVGEELPERKYRLERAYEESKKLLDAPGDFYENGVYKQVEGTPYTRLNAYKYMLKSHNKKLKGVERMHRSEGISPSAFDDCRLVREIVKHHMDLDMAPHCLVQTGKFYASMDMFEEAFETFREVFKSKAVNALTTRRPNSFAWVADNYARAVEAYAELDEEDLPEKTKLAHERCCQVLSLKINSMWKKKMSDWVRTFSLLD